MKVLTIDYQDKNAPELFAKSLKETGFAVLKNHPISPELLKSVYSEWDGFFNGEYKSKYLNGSASEDDQGGYFPYKTETAKGSLKADLKEFYQFYEKCKLPLELTNKTRDFYEQSLDVAQVLLGWLQDNAPANTFKEMDMPLKDVIENSQNTLLRIINYPPLSGQEELGAVRASAHSDINLLTILPASTQPGLQVRDIDGNWHNVECDENTLAINTGDMISKACNSYYPSTIHRVVNPIDKDAMKNPRMSMPLFLHARPEVKIKNGLIAGDYLEKRLIEIGIIKK
jgi:isopenicillin N synthase-like dioxygenase